LTYIVTKFEEKGFTMPLIHPPSRLPAGALLTRLHAINTEYGYLPEEALRHAASELAIPLSQIYSIATFYASFSLEPRGRHKICVCEGTACYIRGSDQLMEKLEATLDICQGQTTVDQQFTLETVYCVGSCSMAPVVRVDDDTYGRLKPDRLPRILKKYQSSKEPES
jgi:NADH:ubiquinone oxidoreductase subunit E